MARKGVIGRKTSFTGLKNFRRLIQGKIERSEYATLPSGPETTLIVASTKRLGKTSDEDEQ